MHAVILVMALASGQVTLNSKTGQYLFKQNGTTKATIEAGGFVAPAAVATASLPGTCKDGAIVYDSTAHAMRFCYGNAWGAFASGAGAAPATCSAGQVETGNGTSHSCVSVISTASALASDPTACGSGQYVSDISASGALTCSTPTATVADAAAGVKGALELDTDLGGTAAAPQVVATHLSAPLPQAQGGTGAGALTCSAGQALTSNGTAYSCADVGGGISQAQVMTRTRTAFGGF